MVLRSMAALVLLALVLGPASAAAQTDRRVDPGAGVAALPATPAPFVPIIDYREQMRRFVERIAAFARNQRPDFVVVVRGGLELVSKAELPAPPAKAPATRYLRTIDGILVEPIGLAPAQTGGTTPEDRRTALATLVAIARDHSRHILVMSGSDKPDSSRFVPRLANARGRVIAGPRALRRDRFAENPASVLSLKDVMNFLYLGDSSGFGREDEFAFALHQTNDDMVVVDAFHGRRPLGERAVETLKYKKLGAKRLVLAHLDIGTAAGYLYYWQPVWNEVRPSWIGEPVPGDPDRYYVEYWRPEWQDIISGNAKSYVSGLIDRGYDGVVLDGIETYRYFEGGDVLPEATD